MMRGAALYQNSRVVGARPETLVVLLYERLMADLRGAAEAIAAGEYEVKARQIDHALEILFELLGTLDHDSGGEVAGRLATLYSYFIAELTTVGRSLEIPRLERVIAMIDGLYQSWCDVAVERAAATPSGPVGAGR